MKNKKLKTTVLVIGILISILLIIWVALYSILPSWWQITFADWVPIFIGFEVTFIFSYFLANKLASYERKLATYESIIIKMQQTLTEDPAQIFQPSMPVPIAAQKLEFYQQQVLMYFKKLNNLLTTLNDYRGDLDIEVELACIKQELDSYKFDFTENLYDTASLREKRNSAQKSINIIDYNLDKIRLKLHSN